MQCCIVLLLFFDKLEQLPDLTSIEVWCGTPEGKRQIEDERLSLFANDYIINE